MESRHSLVLAEGGRPVALLGTDNLVVVDTKDALLVCSKDKVQQVKSLMPLLPKSVI
jgi:hypothetical protein